MGMMDWVNDEDEEASGDADADDGDAGVEILHPEDTLAGPGIAADEDCCVLHDTTIKDRIESFDSGFDEFWH